MDPITLIINALVSGFLKSFTEEAAKDAYTALKSALLKKYRNINIEQFENNPTSKAAQENIKRELRAAGAGEDEEVLRLATGLLELIETPNEKTSKEKMWEQGGGNELIEYSQWNGGSLALKKVFDKHFSELIKIRQNHPISNVDLLSSRVANNRDIPNNIAEEMGKLHIKVREIIQGVAVFIESRKYIAAEQAINGMELAHIDRNRAKLIVQADRKINISYQTLKATIEYFKEINEMIRDRIENTDSPKMESHLALSNAILVYELTDYVINYIDGFSVDGYQEIINLYSETNREIEELRRQQKQLEQNANQSDIEPAVRTQALENIKSRENSIQVLEKEWNDYISSVKSLQSELGSVKRKLPTLKIIRDDAQIQIKVLQAVEMLRILKQNITTVETTILTLESIRLISMSPERVKRLLGVN